MKVRKSLFSLALFSVSVLANAASMSYTDQTAFNSALSSAGLTGLTQDFTAAAAAVGVADNISYGVADPDPILVGTTSFTGLDNALSNGSAGYLVQNTYGIAGAFYSHQLYSENGDNLVKITFASPVKGFGFSNTVFNIGGNPFVWPTSGTTGMTLTTSTGDVLKFQSPISSISGLSSGAPLTFSGLVSDTAFTSVTLETTQAIGFNITNFTVAAVPEPESYAMLLAGLGLMGAIARRRKNKQS